MIDKKFTFPKPLQESVPYAMLSKTSFADATRVKPTSSHTYEAHFADDWCIGSVPHGGYVTSIFQRVAEMHFATTLSRQNQPNTITLHLEFLRRTSAGPATFTVKDTKIGRQTSTIHVSLTQSLNDDSSSPREEVCGYITNTNLSTESGPSFPTEWALHPPPPPKPKSFRKLVTTGTDGNWATQGSVPFPDFRKASHKIRFYFPQKGQTIMGCVDQWMRFTSPDPDLPTPEEVVSPTSGSEQIAEVKERFTNASIGFVCDMWPQLLEAYFMDHTFGIGSPGSAIRKGRKVSVEGSKSHWYPTLLLNLDIKKSLPPEGVEFLFVRVRAKSIKNGRYDLEIVILDEDEDLVALSHHVVFILSASRNLAGRGSKSGEDKTKEQSKNQQKL